MALRTPNSGSQHPEIQGEPVPLQFEGTCIDPVKEAKDVLRAHSIPRWRRLFGRLATKGASEQPDGWSPKPETKAARTLLTAVQIMTEEALKEPERYSTNARGGRVNFVVSTGGDRQHEVSALYGDSDLDTPTDCTVEQRQADQLVSTSYTLWIDKNDFVRNRSTPPEPNQAMRIYDMTTLAGELLAR